MTPTIARSHATTQTLARSLTAAALTAVCLLAAPPIARAQAPAVPAFTGQRVVLVGSPQGVDPASLRDEITRVEKAGRQTYYVVVVKNAGSSAHAAKDFTDTLARTWPQQAQAGRQAFDTRRAVLIVLELDHRKIVVLGGTELQQNFGFRDPYIDRELIQPYFAPAARAGDLTRALRVLIDQTDRWITAKDAEQASHYKEVAARSEQLRLEAADALADTRRDLEEARRDLATRHAEGLASKDFDTGLARVAAGLDTAQARLAQAPAEALDAARQAQRDLAQLSDQIRQVPALQAELDQRLSATGPVIAQVNSAIDTARQAQAPTDHAEHALAQARAELDQARSLIKPNPAEALKHLDSATHQLHDTLQHALALPAAQAALAKARSSAADAKTGADAAYLKASLKGISLADFDTPHAAMNKAFAEAETDSTTDPVAALAKYEAAGRTAQAITAQLQPRLKQHQLYYRTLPAVVILTLASLVAALTALLWRRRKRFRETVLGQFRDYRSRTVGLMEELDELRKQHGSLLKTDPDFTRPTTGQTLAAYQGLETDLNALWDKWLAMMELWERADGLVKRSRGFNSSQIAQAKALLEGEGRFEGIEEQAAACRQRLQELADAHAIAAHQAAQANEAEATLKQNLGRVAAAGLPTAACETALKPAQTLLQKSAEIMVADPLGAQNLVAEARTLVDSLNASLLQTLALVDQAQAVRISISHTADQAAALRQTGLKLTEPRANPDQRLEKARKLAESVQAALQRSDIATAARCVTEAESLATAAADAIKAHLEARDLCPKRLDEAQAQASALASQLQSAKAIFDTLQAHFHPDSFHDIAPNLAHAAQLQASALGHLQEAARQSADSTQLYLAAAESVDQANAAIMQAQAELGAITARHNELAQMAEAVRAELATLQARHAELQSLYQAHQREIGPETAAYFATLADGLSQLGTLARSPRPHWPEANQQAESVRNGLELAARQAQEEIQGHARLAEQLSLVRSRLQAVGRLLQQEDKDRPPANQRYQQAVESMGRYESNNPLAESNWDERLRWLQEIAESLDRAESLANQDINLANGALSEIESAGRTIRKVQAYYRSGVSADLGQAESLLQQARRQVEAQEYESAVNLAQQAEHAASVAYNAAEHQARQRRNQQDRTVVMGDWSVIAGTLEAARRSAEQWSRQTGGGLSLPTSPDTNWTSDSTATWGGTPDNGSSGWPGSSTESGW